MVLGIVYGMAALLIGLQVYSIVYTFRNESEVSGSTLYTRETIEKTKRIMEAIKVKRIKKHILTNDAPKYDSRQTVMQYNAFLQVGWLAELSSIEEERYNG